MSYPINYPTPQNANVQIYTAGGVTSDWVKPQGCSFVFFTLIGAGGNGFGGTTSAGGGGGAGGGQTLCLVPAFLIPDVLRVTAGKGGAGNLATTRTRVEYQLKAVGAYELIYAPNGANSISSNGAGSTAAAPSNYFIAMGFGSFYAGGNGANQGANAGLTGNLVTGNGGGGASTTTGSGGTSPGRFGYPTLAGGAGTTGGDGRNGISIFSNILTGQGGSGGGGSTTGAGGNGGDGGIGSGGGGGGICTSGTSQGGKGGDGLVVIVSW
jgi:hypothetical protein